MKATCWPISKALPGATSSMMPTPSMPRTRGYVKSGSDRPRREWDSDSLMPKASTRTRSHPGRGRGTGSWETVISSISQGPSRRIASIIALPGSIEPKCRAPEARMQAGVHATRIPHNMAVPGRYNWT